MSGHDLRRCRPLLGTFVEISASGPDQALLERAMTGAFDTMARMQALLSAHDARSELSRLNRQAGSAPLQIGRHLWRVLRCAASLARESDGAFDATLGSGGFELLAGRRVSLVAGARLDLGGIAKGYCVDRAVEALRCRGAHAGLVNAGGDLRAFGNAAYPLQLRHPGDARRLVALGELRESALATSASYAADDDRRSLRGGTDLPAGLSISVRAPTTMLADALTKVVARLGDGAAPLLARHRAVAWAITA